MAPLGREGREQQQLMQLRRALHSVRLRRWQSSLVGARSRWQKLQELLG